MSYASEVKSYRDWLPNSYRFATQDEAEAFIAQVKEQWIPKDFVRATRTIEVDDPTNARWDSRKKDAVKFDVKDLAIASTKEESTDDYVPPPPLPTPPDIQEFIVKYGSGSEWPFAASREALQQYDAAVEAWRESVRSGDRWYDRQDLLPEKNPPEEEPHRRALPTDKKPEVKPAPPIGKGICEDCSRRQSKPSTGPLEYAVCMICNVRRACFDVETPEEESIADLRRRRAMYGDPPTNWKDYEDLILQNETLRHDLRHMLAHGECRYPITRKIVEGFKKSHNGNTPGDTDYVISGRHTKKYIKKLEHLNLRHVGDEVGNGMMIEIVRWLDSAEGRACLWESKSPETLSAMKAADRKRRIERKEKAKVRKARAIENAKSKKSWFGQLVNSMPEEQQQKARDMLIKTIKEHDESFWWK